MKVPQQLASAKASRRPRIVAIDLVRIVVIAAVIATHIAATGPLYNSPTSGVIWMFSHVSRNLFIALTAIVLFYNYGSGRPFNARSFYLKRFTLVAIPYATWTLIYQVGHGLQQHTVFDFIATYLHNFVTAGAMYHLYFLLLTMQLYLLFPLLRHLYEKVKSRPWHVLAVSLGFQLVVTGFIQYGPSIPSLNWWLDTPDNYLLSYQFYIVAGVLIAAHISTFERFVTVHLSGLSRGLIAVLVLNLGLYSMQVIQGVSPNVASAVFQPYLVIESAMVGVVLFAAGFHWSRHGARFHRMIAMVGEDSFGIYLGHVFLISYLASLQPAANGWVVAAASLMIGLPAVYLLTFIFIEFFRHTRLSLLLTGRRRASWTSNYRPLYARAEQHITQTE